MKNKVFLAIISVAIFSLLIVACAPKEPENKISNNAIQEPVLSSTPLEEGYLQSPGQEQETKTNPTSEEEIVITDEMKMEQEQPVINLQERKNIYFYPENVKNVTAENQKYLVVSGDLPNPCHKAAFEIVTDKKISLNIVYLFSYLPSDFEGKMCIETLQPFEIAIPLPDNEFQTIINP